MGHSSKFVFPLPGRKPKSTPQMPPPSASTHLTTKAQRILGTSDPYHGSFALPAWETQSNSGISIAVTETTDGARGQGAKHDARGASGGMRERRWEQESDVIPSALIRNSDMVGSMVPDGATDASSVRRRQSSSTITSYYDKTTLPLAISQQTSNSAMAKGLPTKAQALLDIDGELTESGLASRKAKKKPSRLDLSALLQKHRSPKHLRPDVSRGHRVGHDMFTKSPSPLSASPTPTPPPAQQRTDRGIRKKLTKESLRENPAQQPAPYGFAGWTDDVSEQPTKASLELYHLYDHYEQRSFADAMDQDIHDGDFRPEPPTSTAPAGNGFLSPFTTNAQRSAHTSKHPPLAVVELRLAGVSTSSESSPVPVDCASVSSRHTRTSKASKRTDRSLQELDLLQNSVLALSSDSEDDCELSSKGSLAVPALSDGQTSPTSPRSPVSQTSAVAYEGTRGKPSKRASCGPSPHHFLGNQGSAAAAKGPKISPRTSSLNSQTSAKLAHALVHETSRLSIRTTSTDRTVSHASGSGLHQASMAHKAPRKVRSDSQFDFPAPPASRGGRSACGSRASEHSTPVSPTSVDVPVYMQSLPSPPGLDNGSIRSGTGLGSTANRRNSAASSVNDSSSGRFMAVTRQEEMLLAALRMKRARMREDIIAEFEEEADREDHHQLSRQVTNESIFTAGSMSRQSSRSTMRQEVGALSARPRQQSQASAAERMGAGEPLPVLVDRRLCEPPMRPPALDTSGITYVDDGIAVPSPGGFERNDSRARSMVSQKSGSVTQRASLSALAAPAPRRSHRREAGASRRVPEQASPRRQNDLPRRILEDPAEDDDAGIPRPDSPISPADFPTPVSIKNKKQVRLSAVGFYKPAAEAGW
ncbi:hypothetical protein N658DRAFT_518275 [Parathielavia hyrcaniae]|uniref:Uncharacterized protein n=1 Tax=Parathielavia hyrcaniae TaxID=113614 RepID=A0AAN6PZ31_9PEZI|nr:hypothetical protein N658DRAFT_518275 [Parathielavia hyrcaniae]